MAKPLKNLHIPQGYPCYSLGAGDEDIEVEVKEKIKGLAKLSKGYGGADLRVCLGFFSFFFLFSFLFLDIDDTFSFFAL